MQIDKNIIKKNVALELCVEEITYKIAYTRFHLH